MSSKAVQGKAQVSRARPGVSVQGKPRLGEAKKGKSNECARHGQAG